jgi:Bacteriocin-protection, YdeI or OmpD-Associated
VNGVNARMESKASIVEKLKLEKYDQRLILNLPEAIDDFQSLEFDPTISKEQYDLIFIFVLTLEQFATHLKDVVERNLLSDTGDLYFAYPKKGNSKYDHYIGRDEIYNDQYYNAEGYVHGNKLKFARMVSLNDVFTVVGMKNDVKKQKVTKSSQKVDDYVDFIDQLKTNFKNNEPVLKIYNELTPGYQKDWARYVYSAKRENTQVKRLKEMEDVLLSGYKTMDLYRLNKK